MLNNTTTSFLQKKPDFYNSVEECSESLKNKIQTNPRYKNFNQTHFTAGDEEQFLEYKYEKNGENKDVELKDNIYSDKFFYIWKGYHDLEAHVVLKTFRYIFNKFKKGIFVKIVNNELKVFLPFSNANFVNEWNHKIHYFLLVKAIQTFLSLKTCLMNYVPCEKFLILNFSLIDVIIQ